MISLRRSRRVGTFVLALAMIGGACATDEDVAVVDDVVAENDEPAAEDEPAGEDEPVEEDLAEEDLAEEDLAEEDLAEEDLADDESFDDESVEEDMEDDESAFFDDCTQEALSGDDPEFVFTSAYRVDGGELSERCLGDDDPTILAAWDALATISPPTQLSDLALFGGFEPDGDGAAETLAFVNALDADGGQFQMSVNVVEADVDPDELLLTLAHELTHVFASTATQLDRTDEAIDACATYFNGEGCYLPDSLMWAWIEAFWNDDLLASVDPFEDSPDDADARCAIEAGFFGSYAATNPEEDFAEAFSAFVFRLEPDTDGQADRLGWIAEQPGLAEFRDRADAAGLTPLANNFDICGP